MLRTFFHGYTVTVVDMEKQENVVKFWPVQVPGTHGQEAAKALESIAARIGATKERVDPWDHPEFREAYEKIRQEYNAKHPGNPL